MESKNSDSSNKCSYYFSFYLGSKKPSTGRQKDKTGIRNYSSQWLYPTVGWEQPMVFLNFDILKRKATSKKPTYSLAKFLSCLVSFSMKRGLCQFLTQAVFSKHGKLLYLVRLLYSC